MTVAVRASVPGDKVKKLSGAGGTGRRAGLRSQWPQGRAGSSPVPRTNPYPEKISQLRCVTLRTDQRCPTLWAPQKLE